METFGEVFVAAFVELDDGGNISLKARRIAMMAAVSFTLIASAALWFSRSGSDIRVASAFSRDDVRKIRDVVRRSCWLELRMELAGRNFKRAWSYGMPLVCCRIKSIDGFPGPPGGASVSYHGPLGSDIEGHFMVFNNARDWNCQSIELYHTSEIQKLIRQQ